MLGGILTSNPTAITYNGGVEAFVSGKERNSTIRPVYGIRSTDGVNWSPFFSLGGNAAGQPKAINQGASLGITVLGTGNTWYYNQSADGTNFSGWYPGDLGGTQSNLANFNGQGFDFLKGGGGDAPLCVKSSNVPAGCETLGGILTSNPSVQTYNGQMYVFVKGSDNGIYIEISDTAGNFTPNTWTNLGGVGFSDPQTMVSGGLLYIYVLGTSSTWYYQTYNGQAWSGWAVGGPGGSTNPTAYLNNRRYDFSRNTSSTDSSLIVCPAPPTGSIGASSCAIPSRGTTCQSLVSWSSANVSSPSNLVIKNRNTGQLYYPPSLSGSMSLPIPQGVTTFDLATAPAPRLCCRRRNTAPVRRCG